MITDEIARAEAQRYAAYITPGQRGSGGAGLNITIEGWRADVEAAYLAGRLRDHPYRRDGTRR